jgi:transposase-like protein
MRYPASEKLEIIKLVEQSHLPVRRTLEKLGIARATFYHWYDLYRSGVPKRWQIAVHGRAGCGTAFPMR